MFFRKKKSEQNSPYTNLRRRFHHSLLLQRKTKNFGNIEKSNLPRIRRFRQGTGSPKLRATLLYGGITAAFAGIVYLVFVSSVFTIAKISLEKNGTSVSPSRLAPFIDVLKGKKSVLLNTDALEKELLDAFKNEIAGVRAQVIYPQRLNLKIEEYPVVFNLSVKTPDGTQHLVVNSAGYATSENTEDRTAPTLSVTASKPFKVHTVIIDHEKLDPILKGFDEFNRLFGMKIIRGEWKKAERELHLTTEKDFTVWLDITGDVAHQLNKLKRALVKLDIFKEPLEYIDLRIAGGDSEKVIFKRKKT